MSLINEDYNIAYTDCLPDLVHDDSWSERSSGLFFIICLAYMHMMKLLYNCSDCTLAYTTWNQVGPNMLISYQKPMAFSVLFSNVIVCYARNRDCSILPIPVIIVRAMHGFNDWWVGIILHDDINHWHMHVVYKYISHKCMPISTCSDIQAVL